ncbi:MAG: type I-E CRISPR-associated protein Cse1/CasA [Thermodesulfobacteriota bacterium]
MAGGGKFTSLRGGRPLSTLLIGETLWETAWLNVLEARHFEPVGPSPEHCFPWLAPEKFIKAKTGRSVSSEKMAPVHVYWGMPRRVLLQPEQLQSPVSCGICGQECRATCVRKFLDATMGMSYYHGDGKKKKPSWIRPLHPLSPYEMSKGYPSALHPPAGGLTYRHWLGLVYVDGDSNRQPATVIQRFLAERDDLRLWAYGYEMASANARYWHESIIPLVAIPAEVHEVYRHQVTTLVRAAQYASGALILALLRTAHGEVKTDTQGVVLWKPPKHLRSFDKGGVEQGDELAAREKKAWWEEARLSFWQTTEPAFLAALHKLGDLSSQSVEVNLAEDVRGFLRLVEARSTEIFDRMVEAGSIGVVDSRRVSLARQDMLRTIRGLARRFDCHNRTGGENDAEVAERT